MKDRKVSVTEFAKRINTNRNNVYDIFKRKSIDTELLFKISKILSYNFFELFITPKDSDKILLSKRELEVKDTELKNSQARIEQLELQNKLLQNSLKDKDRIIALLGNK